MKTISKFAHVSIVLSILALSLYVFTAPARAAVTPSFCFEMKKETFTRSLTRIIDPSFGEIGFDGPDLPLGFYTVVVNPSTTTEERRFVKHSVSGNALSYVSFDEGFLNPHQPGETLLISYDGHAVFGYTNSGSTAVSIARGVSPGNYFIPGPLVYSSQPTTFLPGVHEDVFKSPVVLGRSFTWRLGGSEAVFNGTAENPCGTITYQGRLGDGANAANGQYDMRFQPYDTETGGATQGLGVDLDNVQVTNGVFTVQLKIGSSLTKNFSAKFLEIGVKPGNAAAGDPYTILTPRQPITTVPYAINAQYSTSANNAAQLGGLPPASYMLTAAALGQRVDTVVATANLQVSTETQTYTEIPGLTKTLPIPEKSSLFISTDGGMQSTGGLGSFSVVDIAIFIDGVEESSRRGVVNNSLVPLSVDNWALSIGKTLPAGSHTFSVRAKGGTIGVPANLTSGGLLGGQLTITVVRW